MYKLDKCRDFELDTCNLDYWFSPGTWQTQLYFFYKVFVQEQASRFCSEKKAQTNKSRETWVAQWIVHMTIWDSPAHVPDPVELGAAFPWLAVTLLSATDSRTTCHLGSCPVLSQGDSSRLSFCLCQQICLFPEHWSWWITGKKYPVPCRNLVKQINVYFVLGQDRLSFTWTDPAWAFLCLQLVCIFLFQLVSQMTNIVV